MTVDLPAKRQRFVEEYLIDLNATQAAIRAGYSARTADVQGAQLLGNLRVAQAVAEAKAERSRRLALTADRVLEEVAALAFSKLGDYARWDTDSFELIDSDEIDSRAVLAVTQKTTTMTTDKGDLVIKRERGIKLHDKVASLKILAQHLGIINERPGDQAVIQNVQVVVRPIDYYAQMTALGEPDEGDDAG